MKNQLIICGRSEAKMQALMKQLNNDTIYYECFDITNDELRSRFIENVKTKFDRIDVVINNAGANTKKDLVSELNLDDLRYMFELNCVASVAMIQGFYDMMKKTTIWFIYKYFKYLLFIS